MSAQPAPLATSALAGDAASSRWVGWSALGLVYVLWGSVYAAAKLVVADLPPLASAGARFVIAGALLGGWLAWRRRAFRGLTRTQRGSAAFAGVLLIAGSQVGIVTSLILLPSGISALLFACIPLWLALFHVIAGERIGGRTAVGLVLGFAGVGIVIVESSGLPHVTLHTALLGGGLALAGALSHALGTWLTARAAPEQRIEEPLATAVLHMGAGGVTLFVAGVARGELTGLELSAVPASAWGGFAWALIAGSLIGYGAYIVALARLPVSTVGTYAFANPVVACIVGWLVLDETMSWPVTLGAGLVLAAVALTVSDASTRARDEGG